MAAAQLACSLAICLRQVDAISLPFQDILLMKAFCLMTPAAFVCGLINTILCFRRPCPQLERALVLSCLTVSVISPLIAMTVGLLYD